MTDERRAEILAMSPAQLSTEMRRVQIALLEISIRIESAGTGRSTDKIPGDEIASRLNTLVGEFSAMEGALEINGGDVFDHVLIDWSASGPRADGKENAW